MTSPGKDYSCSYKLWLTFFSPAKLDLKTICEALGSIKTKWFEFGIQLGISRNKLLEFEKERDPLSAVIDYWLRGNVTESSALISWQSIVAVLKSKYVGETGLAEEISKEYCQQRSIQGNSK